MKFVKVTVNRLVPLNELDPEDQKQFPDKESTYHFHVPNPARSNDEMIRRRGVDYFHTQLPITNLELFDITAEVFDDFTIDFCQYCSQGVVKQLHTAFGFLAESLRQSLIPEIQTSDYENDTVQLLWSGLPYLYVQLMRGWKPTLLGVGKIETLEFQVYGIEQEPDSRSHPGDQSEKVIAICYSEQEAAIAVVQQVLKTAASH